MKNIIEIKAVLFDMGNVILDVDHMIYCKKFSMMCNLPEEKIYENIVNTKLEDDYERGIISSKAFFKSVIAILNLNIGYKSFHSIYSNIFSENQKISEIVYFLKKKTKIILISNTNESHFSWVSKKFKIMQQFDDYILSYKTGLRKPQNEIYLHALKKMNYKIDKVLYIDDVKDFVDAAQKLGIKSILFDSAENLRQELSKYSFI